VKNLSCIFTRFTSIYGIWFS